MNRGEKCQGIPFDVTESFPDVFEGRRRPRNYLVLNRQRAIDILNIDVPPGSSVILFDPSESRIAEKNPPQPDEGISIHPILIDYGYDLTLSYAGRTLDSKSSIGPLPVTVAVGNGGKLGTYTERHKMRMG